MVSVRRLSLFPLLIALLFAGRALAEMTVPVDLQLDLMKRVVKFERGFSAHSGALVHVVIVTKPGNAASDRAATQLKQGLEHAPEIVGKPVQVVVQSFTSAAELKHAADGAAIVYLTPGLEGDIPAIATAFAGVAAITISADGEAVGQGAVLGFELFSSRPRIVLNLAQAGKQGLDFSSDLARLARVIR